MSSARLAWIDLTGLILVIAGALTFSGDAPAPPPPATPTATADPPDPGAPFLEITQPAELESVALSPAFTVAGRTRADAVVSINEVIVEPGVDGRFSLDLTLVEGPTIIEVVASIATGVQLEEVVTVIFAPYGLPGGSRRERLLLLRFARFHAARRRPMEPLTLDEANQMLAGAVAKAKAMQINPCCVAILDPRGDLIALSRMDGALWRSGPISQGKAAASAAFDTASGDLTERWGTPVVRGLSMMENGRLIPWQGALPIRRKDGIMLGAIGVSGAKSNEDEEVAAAGLAAAGF